MRHEEADATQCLCHNQTFVLITLLHHYVVPLLHVKMVVIHCAQCCWHSLYYWRHQSHLCQGNTEILLGGKNPVISKRPVDWQTQENFIEFIDKCTWLSMGTPTLWTNLYFTFILFILITFNCFTGEEVFLPTVSQNTATSTMHHRLHFSTMNWSWH